MQYIVTWSEGEEVFYRFVSEEEIKDIVEDDKKYIIAGPTNFCPPVLTTNYCVT
jgi:hypothetical protein